MDRYVRTRREVLKALASTGSLAALPESIRKAAAIPAHQRTGTLRDVEHIVVLTQENRSFDHYFGTLRGVRGFGDPRAMKLPSGKTVWHQPGPEGEVLPYRPPVAHLGASYLPDPPHGWNDGHAAWNDGRYDQWIASKGIVTMAHNRRSDVPYHFALAEAFTICDAYHCSLMGPTDPNRYHLWTGWVGNDGSGDGPVITNAEAGYGWTTFPERLLAAGVSWKVYQDIGDGLFASDNPPVWYGWTSDPFIGNYGDNSLLYFKQVQNAPAGSALALAAKSGTEIRTQARDPLKLLADFRADIAAGRLPQVSYIAAPEAYTEHPNWPTDFGAWYLSQVLEALTEHPEVWSRTVLLVNYDEEGGFFDHMVPPTPPLTPAHGASTVPVGHELFAGDTAGHVAGPYGFGLRVPLFVVSPWSRGGWVNSQLFDHTSVIQFIERRFAPEHPGLRESNIQPWRRAVAGDLTTAFDFRTPNANLPALPSVNSYMPVDKTTQPDMALEVPSAQSLPRQERGVRRSRALPYDLHADGVLDTASGQWRLRFANTGRQTAVFHARTTRAADVPRCYTVEPGKQLTGAWSVGADAAALQLDVHGPNGFYRGYRAGLGASRANVGVTLRYQRAGHGGHAGHDGVLLDAELHNAGTQPARAWLRDGYTGRTQRVDLAVGQRRCVLFPLEDTGRWYDVTVTVDGDRDFRVQAAGRVETGEDGISDPAFGR